MSEAKGIIRRTFVPELRAMNTEEMTVSHLISDATLDRSNDVIEPMGWDLTNFLKNPVVFANHDYSIASIIGKATDVTKKKNGLYATTKFHDMGLGMQAFHLVESGMARAWSVGFRSIEDHSVREGAKADCAICKKTFAAQLEGKNPEDVWVYGRHFTKTELLEYSLVSIPANPNVVMRAMQKGMTQEEADVFFRPEPDLSMQEILTELRKHGIEVVDRREERQTEPEEGKETEKVEVREEPTPAPETPVITVKEPARSGATEVKESDASLYDALLTVRTRVQQAGSGLKSKVDAMKARDAALAAKQEGAASQVVGSVLDEIKSHVRAVRPVTVQDLADVGARLKQINFGLALKNVTLND